MSGASRNQDGPTARKLAEPELDDRRDDGAMSPGMRQLILSYGDLESERVWDANAFARPASNAA
jgi:hypothetical protein